MDRTYPVLPARVLANLPHIPGAPDCDLMDFVRFRNDVILDFVLLEHGVFRDEMKMDVGLLTCRYIIMLFRDPARILRVMDRDYFTSGHYKNDMPPIHFVQFENLNEDIHRTLCDFGMKPEYVDFARRTKRKLNDAKPRPKRHWREHYDDAALSYAIDEEWPLFQMFPNHTL